MKSLEKLKVSFIQFSGCSGCVNSILFSPVFRDFMRTADLCFFPFVTDFTSVVEPQDVTFVEGAVVEPEERALLTEVRSKTEKIVAVGACACLGGVTSLLGNITVHRISDIIKVDYSLPGCPPSKDIVGNFLSSLLVREEPSMPQANLCAECPFKPAKLDYPAPIQKLFADKMPERCFLEDKTLCLGPVTRGGCGALCIGLGLPCEGCNGPYNEDSPGVIINFFSALDAPLKQESRFRDFFKFQKRWKGRKL
ncbi:MAG: hypothetical protein QXJ75_03035 [Candidatus Bathyarchaeia archaeon]